MAKKVDTAFESLRFAKSAADEVEGEAGEVTAEEVFASRRIA